MSQWHREHPELYDQGYEPWDELRAAADATRKAERENASTRREEVNMETEQPNTPAEETPAEETPAEGTTPETGENGGDSGSTEESGSEAA